MTSLITLCGWLGTFCFAICGLPQAIKSYKDGHSDGISNGMIFLWMAGEVFTLIYVISGGLWPLILNYTVNIINVSVIIKYKFYPRTKCEKKQSS